MWEWIWRVVPVKQATFNVLDIIVQYRLVDGRDGLWKIIGAIDLSCRACRHQGRQTQTRRQLQYLFTLDIMGLSCQEPRHGHSRRPHLRPIGEGCFGIICQLLFVRPFYIIRIGQVDFEGIISERNTIEYEVVGHGMIGL